MTNIALTEDVDLRGYYVIVPAVTVGNIAQLAVDLILEKLKPKKIGTLYSEAIIPLAGAANGEEGTDLILSCEMFLSQEFKLVILQIRSPILQAHADDFISEFVEWCKGKGIDKMLILAGVHTTYQRDYELHGPPLRYYATPRFYKESGFFGRHPQDGSGVEPTILDPLNIPPGFSMYGGGIAMNMFTVCFTKNMPVMAIINHCSEGDNVPEAIVLANAVNKFINFAPPNHVWLYPASWGHLFGGGPPEGAY